MVQIGSLRVGDVLLDDGRELWVVDSSRLAPWGLGPEFTIRSLEDLEQRLVRAGSITDAMLLDSWRLIERSLDAREAVSYGSQVGKHPEEKTRMSDESKDTETKRRKGRAIDYTRTNKKPHSFRYKRGHQFVPREGSVKLAKDADGALVISSEAPPSNESVVEYTELEGVCELVNIRVRPNGKTAIVFKHEKHGELIAYDARHARAALRSS